MNQVIDGIVQEVLMEIGRRRSGALSLYREHPDTLTALTISSHTLGDDSSESSGSQDENYAEERDELSEQDSGSESEGGVHV